MPFLFVSVSAATISASTVTTAAISPAVAPVSTCTATTAISSAISVEASVITIGVKLRGISSAPGSGDAGRCVDIAVIIAPAFLSKNASEEYDEDYAGEDPEEDSSGIRSDKEDEE